MKETATEWLFKQLWDEPKDKFTWYTILDKAMQMEKEQIIKANEDASTNELGEFLNGKQFYNETYESNGSDDHLPGVREMAASVQKLIDKDIFNQAILAMEEMYGSGCDAEIDAYFRGAKWMRQELNKQI